MLQTVEAIIEPSGHVRLLEEVHIDSPRRAIVTLLDSGPNEYDAANSTTILKFLADHRLSPSARLSAEEIDAQIETERNAWD